MAAETGRALAPDLSPPSPRSQTEPQPWGGEAAAAPPPEFSVTTSQLSASQPFSTFPPDSLWAPGLFICGASSLWVLCMICPFYWTHTSFFPLPGLSPLPLSPPYLTPPLPFRWHPRLSSRSKPWDCLLTSGLVSNRAGLPRGALLQGQQGLKSRGVSQVWDLALGILLVLL